MLLELFCNYCGEVLYLYSFEITNMVVWAPLELINRAGIFGGNFPNKRNSLFRRLSEMAVYLRQLLSLKCRSKCAMLLETIPTT